MTARQEPEPGKAEWTAPTVDNQSLAEATGGTNNDADVLFQNENVDIPLDFYM